MVFVISMFVLLFLTLSLEFSLHRPLTLCFGAVKGEARSCHNALKLKPALTLVGYTTLSLFLLFDFLPTPYFSRLAFAKLCARVARSRPLLSTISKTLHLFFCDTIYSFFKSVISLCLIAPLSPAVHDAIETLDLLEFTPSLTVQDVKKKRQISSPPCS